MGFLSRFFKPQPGNDPNAVQLAPQDVGLYSTDNELEQPIPFHQYWVKSRQPDPGAAAYAYDTLALMPFYPINRFARVQTPMRATTGPQMWALPAYEVYELPQPTGQMFTQRLFDPNAMPIDTEE